MKIENLVNFMKEYWSQPSHGKNNHSPFPLVCFFEKGDPNIRFTRAKNSLPPDLVEFWTIAESAILFKDIKFGEWGLVTYSYSDAEKLTETISSNRQGIFRDTDLVIGHFCGDSDLLIASLAPEDFGSIYISHPHSGPGELCKVADSFGEFLERYLFAEGNKFWETVNVDGEKNTIAA